LVCQLPCAGIFFNVPDLQPHSFARNDRAVSRDYVDKYVILSDEEMEILGNNLAEIWELDAAREQVMLLQDEEFFQGCLNYFAFLRGKNVTFKDNDSPCIVPTTSLVVDASGKYFPCFYLPPDFGNLPPDRQEEIKERYCRRCFQLRG
jgi:MoaA/NifB/PqqE/SkfB family radical SAM enzyme